MTAPKLDVLPGWRGTDPNGGTWVRMADGEYHPWFHIDRHGTWQWRSQEEAEAAGLVPLVAETQQRGTDAGLRAAAVEVRGMVWDDDHSNPDEDRAAYATADRLDRWADRASGDEAQARLERNPQAVEAIQQAERDLRDGKAVEVEIPAAPAPLDPGNPEDLREVDKFLGRFYASIGIASSSAGSVCKQLRSVADRLDRERAEAEQDAADRERAEEYANGFEDATPDDRRGLRQGYLAGIRALRWAEVVER